MKPLKTLAAGLATVLLVTGCSSGGPYASDAEVTCERFVRDNTVGKVKISGTTSIVEKETENAARWRVSGNVEGTNVLGGPAENRFYCVVVWTSTDKTYTVTDAGYAG